MKRLVNASMLLMVCASCCYADEFYLKSPQTGERQGPFPVKNGAQVKIGPSTFIMELNSPFDEKIKQKLESIVIPEVEFRQANIRDVVKYICEASRQFDSHGEGVNLILQIPAGKELTSLNWALMREPELKGDPDAVEKLKAKYFIVQPITLQLRNVTLEQLLTALGKQCDLDYGTEKGIVVLRCKQ